MSIYGDLSKPQRAMLAALFREISDKRAVPAGRSSEKSRLKPGARDGKSRVDRGGSFTCSGKSRQTARSLQERGLVDTAPENYGWTWRVSLTGSGLELMRSLDFRHVGGSRRRRRVAK